MERTRVRFVALSEWLVAAACVAGAIAAAGVFAGEFRTVRPIVPVIAGAAPVAVAPPTLHPGAIVLPLLVLPDAKELSVGSPTSVLDALGPFAQDGPTVTEREGGKVRETRRYRYAGVEFVVVTSGDRIIALYR
jgi:hypothetical protein